MKEISKRKIQSMSQKQWDKVPAILDHHIRKACTPLDREKAKKAVISAYQLIGKEPPIILFAEGPIQAYKFYSLLYGDKRSDLKQKFKSSLFKMGWRKARLAFFDGGKLAGVEYDEKIFEKYRQIVDPLQFFCPFESACIVIENPVVHFEDGLLHNEHGPSVEFKDGFKLWTIKGVSVDEQIVMRPETQTIKQILGEENQEVKRIRIERYGWNKFLGEVEAKPIDVEIKDGWMECLMASTDNHALCTYDPSTGRIYSLEVPTNCSTTNQAQRYLLAPDAICGPLGIKEREMNTYPLFRG